MTRDIGELKRFARFLYHLSQALNSIEGNAKLTYHTKEIEGFMEYTMKQIMRLENSKSFLETLNFDHTNGDFT